MCNHCWLLLTFYLYRTRTYAIVQQKNQDTFPCKWGENCECIHNQKDKINAMSATNPNENKSATGFPLHVRCWNQTAQLSTLPGPWGSYCQASSLSFSWFLRPKVVPLQKSKPYWHHPGAMCPWFRWMRKGGNQRRNANFGVWPCDMPLFFWPPPPLLVM